MNSSEIAKCLTGAGSVVMDVHDAQGVRDYALNHGVFRPFHQAMQVDVDSSVTEPEGAAAIGPDLVDLVRLHSLIRSRRVTNVLEFGVGWSTLIMADALSLNEAEHYSSVSSQLRRSEPFRLHSVDDSADWIELAASRLSEELRDRVIFHQSRVEMTTFGDRICTQYESLPNTCPDLIYLDGPSQPAAQGDVNGISTRNNDRMPMSCDIAKIEPFLLPGTLIVVDGRTANARFLLSNLQRGWWHYHDRVTDVHYLELREEPSGRWNEAQIRFCLGESWLQRVSA